MGSLLLAMLLAQAGDVTTTGLGLHQGCREANPLFGQLSFPTIVAVKGGAVVGLAFIVHKGRKEHPRTAKAVTVIATTSGLVGMTWNTITMVKGCRES